MRNAVLRAYWLPRLQNEEADALTDSDVGLLGMSKRVDGDQDMLGFVHRNDLFSVGVAYMKELAGFEGRGVPKELLDSDDDASQDKEWRHAP